MFFHSFYLISAIFVNSQWFFCPLKRVYEWGEGLWQTDRIDFYKWNSNNIDTTSKPIRNEKSNTYIISLGCLGNNFLMPTYRKRDRRNTWIRSSRENNSTRRQLKNSTRQSQEEKNQGVYHIRVRYLVKQNRQRNCPWRFLFYQKKVSTDTDL